jgi:hypothetical protein
MKYILIVRIIFVSFLIALSTFKTSFALILECKESLSTGLIVNEIFTEFNGQLEVEYFHVNKIGERYNCCNIKVEYYQDGFFIYKDTMNYLMPTFGYVDFSTAEMGSANLLAFEYWLTGNENLRIPSTNPSSTGRDIQCLRLD